MAPPEAVQLKVAWSVALVIALGAFSAELLPVLFGSGERAACDWGFVYVTLRFVILPVLSLVHLFVLLPIAIVRLRKVHRGKAVLAGLSSVVSIGFLLASYLQPEPWLTM